MKLQDNFAAVATPDGVALSCEINKLECPTRQNPPFENKGNFRASSNRIRTSENENPGALAGATGAEFNVTLDTSAAYRMRAERATTLCLAIADCDPLDAAQIMAAALEDMTGAGPRVPFLEDLRAEAQSWADFATPHELEAYALSALARLDEFALGLVMRKRIFVALWDSFTDADRWAFVRKMGVAA